MRVERKVALGMNNPDKHNIIIFGTTKHIPVVATFKCSTLFFSCLISSSNEKILSDSATQSHATIVLSSVQRKNIKTS